MPDFGDPIGGIGIDPKFIQGLTELEYWLLDNWWWIILIIVIIIIIIILMVR